MRGPGEKREGIKKYSWQLQSSHGDVKYSTGSSQQHCDHHMWCQVGTSQGDHSVSYINVPPLCCPPEMNVILNGNCN